jgi:hypothetical protein
MNRGGGRKKNSARRIYLRPSRNKTRRAVVYVKRGGGASIGKGAGKGTGSSLGKGVGKGVGKGNGAGKGGGTSTVYEKGSGCRGEGNINSLR